METKIQRVAVIGAGVSGLITLKWCLQDGFDCVAYEGCSEVGGLWFFEEEVKVGRACCMKSTVLNTVKEASAMSDFPPSVSSAAYMDRHAFHRYLLDYAAHFDLLKHIRLRHHVQQVEKLGAKWRVSVLTADNSRVEEYFDAVIVCAGNYSFPKVPKWDGMEQFKGTIVHSHQVRDYLCSSKYENKRIVVVGVGASGTDVACESSRVASQVYLVNRRGMWLVSRYANGGTPLADVYNNRWIVFTRKIMGRKLTESIYRKRLNEAFDHKLFGVQPTDFGPLEDRAHICDEIWNAFGTGRVQLVRSDISHFSERSVHFHNQLVLSDIDYVVLCTGYDVQFPFLSQDLFDDIDQIGAEGAVRAYARQIVHEKQPTLAFVGYIMPSGPAVPSIELQARVVTSLWSGRTSLDRVVFAYRTIAAKEQAMFRRNPKIISSSSAMNGLLTNYGIYMDALAETIDCKPPLVRLFFTDNPLWRQLVFSSWCAYQYRLHGAHKWDGARDAIMNMSSRRAYVINVESTANRQSSLVFVLLMLFLAVLLAYSFNLASL